MNVLHEQAQIPVADPQAFGKIKAAIQDAFSPAKVKKFLQSVERAGLRIRDYDLVLRKGLLGSTTIADYDRLSPSDQGQIREFYLASLEKVAPELRKDFFKLYAYY